MLVVCIIQSPCHADTHEGVFIQKLNHNDPYDTRTFKQRYFINSDYAKEGGNSPVLYYIVGEEAVDFAELKNNSALPYFAEKLGANIVVLEHRYYGKSQPFLSSRIVNLEFLNVESALKDFYLFQKHAVSELRLRGKWIVMGGSYGGSLAAYYRTLYPEIVVGALASSAPIAWSASVPGFDSFNIDLLTDSCAERVFQGLEKIKASINHEFALKLAHDLHVHEFAYDGSAYATIYSGIDRMIPRDFQKLCVSLKDKTRDPSEVILSLIIWFYIEEKHDPLYVSGEFLERNLNDERFIYSDMIAWNYQACTELLIKGDPARAKQNEDKQKGVCEKLLKIKGAANYAYVDELYHKILNRHTSRIIFTNGNRDRLSLVSLTSQDSQASLLTTFTIFGGTHCDDLQKPRSDDFLSIKEARELFLQSARVWLSD